MNKASRSILIAAALMLAGVTGCQKSDAPPVTSNGAPPQTVTNAAPIPQMPKGDPSLPDAASALAAQDAAEKAKAMQDATALQQKPAPREEMTNAEESKAMPLPSQANDHSTTALDKSKGG